MRSDAPRRARRAARGLSRRKRRESNGVICDSFIAAAVRHGVNKLLTPVFTPPLDTAKGGERTTVQLVGVCKRGEDYHFDFAKLDRWIGLCGKNGIEYLEIRLSKNG